MKVRKNDYTKYKIDNSEINAVCLTKGKEYLVIGIEGSLFRIFNDIGEPVLYPYSFFEITDCSCENWVKILDKEGEIEYYGCKEFSSRYFFEEFFDLKEENIQKVVDFLKQHDKELMKKIIDMYISPKEIELGT